jgi:hypothetical protein
VLLANSQILRDSRGRFYALGHGGRNIVVFDSAGRYLTAIGRAGIGPGEIPGNVMGISMRADSLFVFPRTITIVFGPTLQLGREGNYAGVSFNSAPRPIGSSGSFVGYGNVRYGGDSLRNVKYHVVSAAGERVRSFGVSDTIETGRASPSAESARVTSLFFVIDPTERFLWSDDQDYRLTRWDVASGSAQNYQVVNVPWLQNRPPVPTREEYREYLGRTMEALAQGRSQPPAPGAPRSSTSLMRIDAQQRAWVRVGVAFREGQPLSGPLATCTGSQSDLYPGWRACSLIEVVDLNRGSLLLSQYVEPDFRFIDGSDLAYASREDANGILSYRIFRVRLEGAR